MLPFLESLPRDGRASFYCRAFDLPCFPFKWHLHPEYELTLIVDGRGKRFVGDDVSDFGPGDLVLLGSNLPHTWHSRPSSSGRRSRSIVVHFRGDCFGDGFFHLPELAGVRRLLARSSVGLRFSGAARSRAADALDQMVHADPAGRMLLLLSALADLSRSRAAVRLSSRAQTVPAREHDQRRLDRVLRYINERYTHPLDQVAVAQLLHLSPSAFSRFFRRMTGRTFVEFVNHLRVHHAARLLADTDEPVTAICFASGFGNLSNFNRRFRATHGCTPRTYRSRLQT